MIGLFQENGPCHFVNGATTPSLNPYSFNEYANMLYVDQPIGTGFSYGTDSVTSTVTAAPYVWTLLQAFYTQFPQYESRDFGIFTESYGGHYGPEFASYFESQNAAIKAGTVKGDNIDLIALGINNGWYVHFGVNCPLFGSKFGLHTTLLRIFGGPLLYSLPKIRPQDKVFEQTPAPAPEAVTLIRF